MRFDYRIVFIITTLLLVLSTSLTVINYTESLDSTKTQLKTSSLPLTVDNIYTKIQKQIIEPNLIASMMSADTFMKNWLTYEEHDVKQISQYLRTIKDKYNMFTVFLVSEKSQNYYTNEGLLERLSINNQSNAWYFAFKEYPDASQVNIDYNEFLGESLVMFINHKIYDDQLNLVGATGIGLKTSYINEMLEYFRLQYNFKVYFVDDSGDVIISGDGENISKHLKDRPELADLMPDIIGNERQTFEYSQSNQSYLLTKKYISELDLHLIIEAKVDNFTQSVTDAFYVNLFVSLLITILITILVLLYVRKIHGQLSNLANTDALTGLANRRTFHEQLSHAILLKARNKQNLSLVFIDVDDFKNINDERGHDVGDKILIGIANILRSTIRKTDYSARWGGEEFIVLLIDTVLKDAHLIAQKLRKNIEDCVLIQEHSKGKVTISLGVTQASNNDDVDSMFKRVDIALYEAKRSGKNRVVVSD